MASAIRCLVGPGHGPEFWSLLTALDNAADTDREHVKQGGVAGRSGPGLTAALRMTALLKEHGCDWTDVLPGEPLLAKLCGRLASEFKGEQDAAYALAMRRVLRSGVRWASLGSIPPVLLTPYMPERTSKERVRRPPEGDWPTTIASLISHEAWRSESERAALFALAERLSADTEISNADAIWLRDVWWEAELLASIAVVHPE